MGNEELEGLMDHLRRDGSWRLGQASPGCCGRQETEGENMTGPDHYRAAEELLDSLYGRGRDEMTVESASIAAEAQVHATLALAAATALAAVVPIGRGNYRTAAGAWLDVTGVVDEV
jgi:hypothetical protein